MNKYLKTSISTILGAGLFLGGLTGVLWGQAGDDKPATGSTTAGGTSASKGIMVEFRRLEEEIRGRKLTPKVRQKMLIANLERAMKNAVTRRFYRKRKELLKELRLTDKDYENPTSPLIYYVRYKTGETTFLVRFNFSRDPEYYIQIPLYEKFLVKGPRPDTHIDDKKTDPAAGGGGDKKP